MALIVLLARFASVCDALVVRLVFFSPSGPGEQSACHLSDPAAAGGGTVRRETAERTLGFDRVPGQTSLHTTTGTPCGSSLFKLRLDLKKPRGVGSVNALEKEQSHPVAGHVQRTYQNTHLYFARRKSKTPRRSKADGPLNKRASICIDCVDMEDSQSRNRVAK